MSQEIVVLGGGFAGVEAAIQLRKKGYKVILISNRTYLFVYPISIWVPVNKKSFDQVQISLNDLSRKHGFELIIDQVLQINSSENTIILQSGSLKYVYLVLALGMGKVKMRGLEHTHSICGQPEEAIVIREELEKLVQQGRGKIAIGFGGNPKDSTATAVRGGPAFELLFNFSHYLKKLKLLNHFEITFFAPMAEPGKKMGDKAYGKLDVFFQRYQIKIRKGKKITHFEKGQVHFEDKSVLESDLVIYISGGDGHPVFQSSDLPLNDAGFVKIDGNCQVQGIDNVYAIGDTAAIVGPPWVAKQGHIAEEMAKITAYNIHQQIIGTDKRQDYQKHLNIICIMDSGDGAAFVMRDTKKETMIPLPIIGHWMKQFWGFYYRNSKLKRIPRIPGM